MKSFAMAVVSFLLFAGIQPAKAQWEFSSIRGALSITIENSSPAYGGVTAQTNTQWVLRLGGGPPNTKFTFWWVKNGQPLNPAYEFGETDQNGNWTMMGTFIPEVAGRWTEWVEFPSGATSNRISFEVGTQNNEGTLYFYEGVSSNGVIQSSKSQVFHVGEKRSLVLQTTASHYNEPFDLCYERFGIMTNCVSKYGVVDGNYAWKNESLSNTGDIGGWTVWIRFKNGKTSNQITFTVDNEPPDELSCSAGTIYPIGPRAGYTIFRRFDTDWRPKEVSEYNVLLGRTGGYGSTLEYLGCTGSESVWLQWAYNRYMRSTFRWPWNGRTDRGLRIGDSLEKFLALYPSARHLEEPKNGPPYLWPSDFNVWDIGPLRVVFRESAIYIMEVSWWETQGDDSADQNWSTRRLIGPTQNNTALWR